MIIASLKIIKSLYVLTCSIFFISQYSAINAVLTVPEKASFAEVQLELAEDVLALASCCLI